MYILFAVIGGVLGGDGHGWGYDDHNGKCLLLL